MTEAERSLLWTTAGALEKLGNLYKRDRGGAHCLHDAETASFFEMHGKMCQAWGVVIRESADKKLPKSGRAFGEEANVAALRDVRFLQELVLDGTKSPEDRVLEARRFLMNVHRLP